MLYYGLEQHSLDSYFQFKELGSAPSTPASNEVRLYAKDDGSGVSTLCYKNDAGTEICLPSSGTIVTGTGVSGRLAFWNGTSTLTSDADLTFSVDTLTATKIIAPTSITISTLTSGSLVFAGASGLLSQDNSNLFWDDTNNRLGIGTTTPERTLHAILSGSATQPIGAHNYSGGATTPINGVLFRSARGTVGSPTAVQADDTAVVLAFQGYGATGFSASKRASMEMLPGENWSDTAQGTYLRFLTTALTGTTTAERFRIGPSGQWGIGGATFGTAGQYFRSGGASAAPTWATIDHNTELANVASGDVHTQYALLAGRSGGQTLIGGTAASDNLTLQSTANATRGKLLFGSSAYDEVNDRLGINITSPSTKLHTQETLTTSPRGWLNDQFSNTAGGALFFGRKSRGSTAGTQGQVLSGDVICAFSSAGSDGTDFGAGLAFIRTLAEENFTSTAQGQQIQLQTMPIGTTGSPTVRVFLSANGNVVLGAQAALNTTDTDGFVYIPTCAGVPSGTPTSYTGKVAMVYDTTDNKLYIYNGGWKTTTVFA